MDIVHSLFLSSWYPTKVNPTNGDFVVRHAQSVSGRCKVGLIHVAYDSDIKGFLTKERSCKNGFEEYIWYFKLNSFLSLFRPIIFVFLYFRVFRLYRIEQGKPNIIHLNVLKPLVLIASMFSIFYKIPFVITEHWTGFLPYSSIKLSKIESFIIRFLSRNNSAVLPVSIDLQKSMQRFGIKGIYKVVQNVVDVDMFKIASDKNTDVIKILHISHLKDDHKNISGILRSVKALAEYRNDFVLEVVSEDSGENLMRLVNDLNICQYVNFLGYKNREALAEIVQYSSFLLLFSNYENFPCVIVEAFACGIPVLSSRVGGIDEHLSLDKGVLVSPKNEQELVDALVYMCDNFKQYNACSIREYAKENFSNEAVSNDIFETYKRILNV